MERAFPKPQTFFELLDVHCPSSVADFHDIHALGTGIDFLQHADTLGGADDVTEAVEHGDVQSLGVLHGDVAACVNVCNEVATVNCLHRESFCRAG